MENIHLFGIYWECIAEINCSELDKIQYRLQDKGIGIFTISQMAQEELNIDVADYEKIKSMIYEYNGKGISLDIIADEQFEKFDFHSGLKTIQNLLDEFPDSILDKQFKILESLDLAESQYGQEIDFPDIKPFQGYTQSLSELEFIVENMKNKKLIKGSFYNSMVDSRVSLTVTILEAGWLYLEEKHKHENSNQAFIAMSFDPKWDSASIEIHKAISDSGFHPFRVDKKQHNNEISGEILFEIKRSRFVIADVTQHKQGVYFEAGYALGLGIPVIWSCKKNYLSKAHFDTRQYSHVVWKDEQEICKKLKDRIKGTILI